ncbi:hypothetical protein [Streptomyces sp. NPDC002790]
MVIIPARGVGPSVVADPLRRLDVIGLRPNAAAADLSDALLKRGH